MQRRYDPSQVSKWLAPIVVTIALSAGVFFVVYTADLLWVSTLPPSVGRGLEQYWFFDPSYITDAVPALGAMIAAVLGIVITVVSIVVQLSASRYPGVATMFLRDRTNIGVMSFYVVSCIGGILLSLSLRDQFVPRATVVFVMSATIIGLVLMAPYFAYVFWFLEPTNIITRIRKEAQTTLNRGSICVKDAERSASQAGVISAMEELTDIVSNSILGKDKIIASRAVDAIKDFVVKYARQKQSANEQWFELGPEIRENPDVVAMEAESRDDLVERRTWVEWKAMRQFLGLYNEALKKMPDINYLIAIDTRYIGEAACRGGDTEVVKLVLRFMNSYLRATLNAKNVRTAYNVLNQYRQLVESLMKAGGHTEEAATAVEHMQYYGHVSYDMQLPFVTETVAYDIGTLCRAAHELGLPEEERMLDLFLDLDQASPRRGQERALEGVRKAQVKLAAYYLMVSERDKARRIFHDMAEDPPDRLRAIHKTLSGVKSKDFWEIIDRGQNFEYMPPEQKAAMEEFFAWFDESGSVRAS